jgi:phospholipid/cholesterol/gamma-HCH transport system substrate-binding protein
MSRVARLGAFIVATVAILAAGVFIVGSKEYMFRSTYRVNAQFVNVVGLAAGADVLVGGVHSGTVHSIALPHSPGEKVNVSMDLDNASHEIVKRDSVASIETEGVLGNQYVAISFGSAGQADVKEGDILQSVPPLDMSDLLKKTNAILDSSRQAVLNTIQATAHLNSVSAKIDSGQGTVGALVNDKQLYSNLAQTTSTLQGTIQQAQVGVTDFQENMEALKHNFLLSGYFKKRGYEDSASLAANRIEVLPKGAPLKSFSFSSKELFEARDSAKLKNRKSLNDCGQYLAQNPFGLAVVVVSAGAEGDAPAQLILTEARAMVVREYLVDNFGFDDGQLKTFGMGKTKESTSASASDSEWGSIQVLVYPVGSEIQADKVEPSGIPVPASSNTSPTAATLARKP